MKTVLAYGDSLTWGVDAENRTRHAYENRWPSVLQKALGHGVRVIAEGLNGRTTVYSDYTADCDRNGARILPTILHTHAPLDLVIIMLGTNDLKPVYANNAVVVGHGIKRLVSLVRNHEWPAEMETPDILIVSPPPLCETDDPLLGPMFSGRIEESHMLASVYADLADELECGFFDAGSVAKTTPVDGVHMDAENTRAVGKGLEPVVRMMLGL
ncbi:MULTISPECIES: SGNH/GDSL hydrolase family protein [unclassified Rhizobium]|uniref:SGNH/GDSL hydrolase family protein n=1 Tax=unclassified Rhizobium TaxID=2613769 RepID=UPI001600573B|nr:MULTISPECIES: SGNH/GDSL hydrolase family protein [unclassified Rhizobium]MBB1247635.1 SGNH/GDSL hydrolase family protein [Rhizobium sp. G21]MCV3764092.1 SGNH/GDSL hydrolase family protein [Rhizobium sp. TRM95796]